MAAPALRNRRSLNTVWSLSGLTVWQLTRRVARNTYEDDLLNLASGLAFNFVLALFPLLLFLLTLFAFFTSRSFELQNSLLRSVADFLPPAATELLNGVAGELAAGASGGRLTFDIVLTLWFASGGMSSMISSLNVALRVRETRSWVKIRTIALGLTLAISILLLFALLTVLAGGHFVNWVGTLLHLRYFAVSLWSDLQWPAALLFVMLSFSLIYNYGPSPETHRWYWITPGSVFGVLLWFAASLAFRAYLHFFNTYPTTYGSLGAVMILLVWLYVAGLSFLIGAEINAEIERAAEMRLTKNVIAK